MGSDFPTSSARSVVSTPNTVKGHTKKAIRGAAQWFSNIVRYVPERHEIFNYDTLLGLNSDQIKQICKNNDTKKYTLDDVGEYTIKYALKEAEDRDCAKLQTTPDVWSDEGEECERMKIALQQLLEAKKSKRKELKASLSHARDMRKHADNAAHSIGSLSNSTHSLFSTRNSSIHKGGLTRRRRSKRTRNFRSKKN